MFYSKSTLGFYAPEDKMPADVVSIDDAYYRELLEGNSKGKLILPDDKGYPILVDKPEPTEDELNAYRNAVARQYLAETDWYVTRFAETGVPIPDEIKQKRAEAREAVQ